MVDYLRTLSSESPLVRNLARIAVLLLVAVGAAGCLNAPGSTGQIALVSTSTVNGWQFDYYRNSAYPCSISGFHTFTIATKVGSSASASAPLWVFLHGGGSGYFDTTGTPQPDATQMTEEPAVNQRSNLLNAGLMAKVRADSAGYRLLAVSYCNRDGYAGTGQTDPNNPNLNTDGSAKVTNGMQATKAAIAFTESTYPTSSYILHGASAGSVGAYYVAYAQQLSGNPPAGVVADASVNNVEVDQAAYQQGACTKGSWSPTAQAALSQRVDPDIANLDNEPDKLVTSGRLTVPLLNIWNHDDVNGCGNHTLTCPLRDGSTITATVTDCKHQPLAAAITAEGPSSTSMNLPVCVTTGTTTYDCDQHQVTIVAGLTNTDPTTPADYLTAIMTWADARTTP